MVLLTLALYLLVPVSASAQETVASICGVRRVPTRISTVEEARQSICGVTLATTNPEIQKLASDSLALLGRMQRFTPNGEYYQALDALAQEANASRDFSAEVSDSKLASFITRYQGADARRNQARYLEDIKAIMATSAIGQRAIDCFDETNSPFAGSEVRFSKTNQESILGTFRVEPLAGGRFRKVLQFDLKNATPERALSLVAHEMMHACDAASFAHQHTETEASSLLSTRKQDELYALVSELQGSLTGRKNLGPKEKKKFTEMIDLYTFGVISREDLAVFLSSSDIERLDGAIVALRAAARQVEQVKRATDQNAALSELRVYQMINVDFFKELARRSPRYFCDQLTPATFQGGITSYGESRAALEESIRDGSFMKDLIRTYSESGLYDPYSFYEPKYAADGSALMENSYDELAKRRFAPEFVEAIRSTSRDH